MAALGTRALVLEMATAAAPTTFVDYSAAVSTAKVTSAESSSDFTSFADAAAGGARQYQLEGTAVQDLATASLWRKTFDSATVGTDTPFKLWPAGKPAGGSPTSGQPLIAGTCTIVEPDGDWLGGDADKSTTARFTFDFSWTLTAKPTLTP
jgi:hypothetical protein